jgi:sialate O-acetylesterase
MKNKIHLFILLSLVSSISTFAEVKLPAIVSSNMVLQRNTTINLWGWADKREKISIDASWLDEQLTIVADKEGTWSIQVKTTNSRAPQTIKITSKSSNIKLENILFGEVWLCSGQSNMEHTVGGKIGQPTFGSLDAIVHSRNDYLRLFTVDKASSLTPETGLVKYSGWQSANPDNVKDFSAIAYFYGQQLQEIIDVPVGMIHASWGGSLIEAWMSDESLSPIQKIDFSAVDLARGNRFPTVLFNGMINPLIPFTIKGVLWYQGEANKSQPVKYTKLFPAMVKDWRKRWGFGDFPFYYVQIAPYLYDDNTSFSTPKNGAFFREAQMQCLDLIPNSGIAITMDIGDGYSIHPPKKKEVADRLLYNALNQTYGMEAIDFSGPVYDSLEVNDGGIILKFKNAETGIYAYENLEGFEIAGADKVFHTANAKIVSKRNVLVKSDKVPNPVAVRYAWRNWIEGTLYDANLLPASSFRTDNWNEATKFKD